MIMHARMPATWATPTMKKKRILVLAPFFGTEGAWIDDFCNRPDLEFNKVPYINRPESWHKRGSVTPLAEWVGHFRYVYRAMKLQPDCVVTSFPQLALIAAMVLPFMGKPEVCLVAWNFNLGSVNNNLKGCLAGWLLRRVDRFIVHARSEIENYADWLAIPKEKFLFMPLQRGRVGEVEPSSIQRPYIVSMGSANRDYETLVEAVRGSGIKTVIISKQSVLTRLPDDPDLVKLSDLTQDECNSILGGSEMNVVPIRSTQTAAGQVTFITSMRMGIPTVATRCVGTVDYIDDGLTGLLVPPEDSGALRRAIFSLWQDAELKSRIGSAGRDYAEQHLSDEAAGRYLSQVLDQVLA